MSFDNEEDEDIDADTGAKANGEKASKPANKDAGPTKKFKSNPNATVPAVKAMTKATMANEAVERDRLRKEFLEVQEKVKGTSIAIPFIFYDGSNIPGGLAKIKKGERIWLILERARKIGAEMGAGGVGANAGIGSKSKEENRKAWARVGVDDLMLLRGEVIVPHHYELFYFIANRTPDPFREGKVLFDYEGPMTLTKREEQEQPLLRIPGQEKLEGHDHDPAYAKVVDRRWYEKNKHIYPASTWKEFKQGEDFDGVGGGRKDGEGNAFFFT